MAAQSLPFTMGTPVPSWEIEAWYEDLQEVLYSDETRGMGPPVGGQEQEALEMFDGAALLWGSELLGPMEQSIVDTSCELDFPPELLELLGEEPAGPTESDSSHSSPAQTGTEDEEGTGVVGSKRKRSSQPQGSSKRHQRSREQENEQRVVELTAQNERLRQDIERLSAEVEATRAALIQRVVNLKR
uniref:DNA damage-inducible transcript 3 protein n=1 Tax=Sphenodon punctatus TaxID=8508 RepID=A0A8D0L5G2_SPHPU